MKKILFILFATGTVYSQSLSKEYSKEIALYQAKFFISKTIIGDEPDYQKFIIDPLAGSKSSELSSIYYEIIGGEKKGLVFGFYDEFTQGSSSSSGVDGSQQSTTVYTNKEFAFKNIDYEDAIKLLDKIEQIIEDEKKFLNADDNENNIYFTFDDMIVIIYREGAFAGRIRIEWNGFDAEWENTAFRRTKRRFKKASEN
jgi:hypothetical protein